MPKWGRRVDVGGGIALGVLSRDVSTWILAPYRGTGQAFDRENDEAEDKKDELGSDSTGATYFRTDDEVGGRYDVASGGNLILIGKTTAIHLRAHYPPIVMRRNASAMGIPFSTPTCVARSAKRSRSLSSSPIWLLC